jgi:5-methylthioadenosine/S-adenosylhomocysteine deaminase
MARGNIIYEKGEFLTLDLDKIRGQVKNYALPHIFG